MSTLRFSRFDIRGMLFAELTLMVLHFHDDIVKTCRERFIVPMLLLSFISIMRLSGYAGKVLLFRYYYCPSFPFWYCQDMPGTFYCSDVIIVSSFPCWYCQDMPETFYCSDVITVLHFHLDIVMIIMPEAFYCLILLPFISCWYRQDMPGRFYCSDVIILLSFISMLISSRYAGKVLLSFISIFILSR